MANIRWFWLVVVGMTVRFDFSVTLADERSANFAVQRMQLPDGLEVTLVASEPMVRQPVAIEFDDRGRLWVIQYLQYPNPEGLERVQVDRYSRTIYDRVPPPPPHGTRGADRITILEDTNGDGVMDTSRDFVDGLNLASGLAHGYGGVFVLNVPYLLFYPDQDRDDIPDSHPQVLLSGFGMEDAHSVANSLSFGPDGWLYGCQGSTVTANIRGIQFQQGVWRYHPIWDRFELFCEGGGNSWGLDFDATGQLLYSTNYGGHVLLHAVQGGYFIKSFAKHGPLRNRFAYGFFDHAPHENFRGGHVTTGGIVYQADALPGIYRNKYIAADLLGHNVLWHYIHRRASTVQTAHGGELMISNDTWFAPCDVTTGPDGATYVADWHDARTAHPDPDADWDRSNGRIYRIAAKGNRPGASEHDGKVTTGQHDPTSGDLADLPTQQLLELHQHPNQWYVRRARLELIRRGDHSLSEVFRLRCLTDRDPAVALESLWTFHAMEGLNEEMIEGLLKSPHPAVREWAIRLLGDQVVCGVNRMTLGQPHSGSTDVLSSTSHRDPSKDGHPEDGQSGAGQADISDHLAHLLDGFAETEPEITVRQQLACTAARLPARFALPLINANIIRDIDDKDERLPLLWWWAVEKHSLSGREEVLKRFTRATAWQSRLGRYFLLPKLIRRYAAEASLMGLDSIQRLLDSAPDDRARQELWPAILAGWLEQTGESTAEGQVRSSDPSNLTPQGDSSEVLERDRGKAYLHEFRQAATQHPLRQKLFDAWLNDQENVVLVRLAIEFSLEPALQWARQSAFQIDQTEDRRIAMLEILSHVNDQQSVEPALNLCESTGSLGVAKAALRLCARSEQMATWQRLLELHRLPPTPEIASDIVDILFSRSESARMLLESVEKGRTPIDSISAEQARRVLLLGDSELESMVSRHWGKMQAASPGEILAEIRRLNNDLRADSGDAEAGKSVYAKHCASCHQLFGQGIHIGPDLTTANRQDRDFLLSSLANPSNSIRPEYVSWVIQTVDGRVLTGLPLSRDDQYISLIDSNNQQHRVPLNAIDQINESPVSLMPQDLYKQLSPQELRDLFAYLQCDLR